MTKKVLRKPKTDSITVSTSRTPMANKSRKAMCWWAR